MLSRECAVLMKLASQSHDIGEQMKADVARSAAG